MKVKCEYIKEGARTVETWYFCTMIKYDPVHVLLQFDSQNVYLPTAQILQITAEADPDTLIF